jgi:23S rRNA pseudouridine2605 synthase
MATSYRYIILNKPVGIVTSAVREKIKDPVPTVYELLADLGFDTQNLGCVGRLDQDTSGLLLFTDDSKLNSRMRGKDSHATKIYRLVVYCGSKSSWRSSTDQLDSLSLPLDKDTLPACIEIMSSWVATVAGSQSNYQCRFTEIRVTLIEGKHRQIRRLCTRAKLRVASLQRLTFGPLVLADLPERTARHLTPSEVSILTSRLI